MTRACSYDRAGFGWSEPGRCRGRRAGWPTSSVTLLDRAGVTPPFVLVGHSFGGLVMRIFAARLPRRRRRPRARRSRASRGLGDAGAEGTDQDRSRHAAVPVRRGAARRWRRARRERRSVRSASSASRAGCRQGREPRRPLRREDEGILAPVWKLPPEARRPLQQFWTEEKFFDALGSQIESICVERRRNAGAAAERLRRSAARHDLVNRSRATTASASRTPSPASPRAAATSSPRTAATGSRSISRRSSSMLSATCWCLFGAECPARGHELRKFRQELGDQE